MKLRWFTRWTLYWAFAGLLAGGIIHLATSLALPGLSKDHLAARFTLIEEPNRIYLLPTARPGVQFLPFQDPDVRYAMCRFDLGGGPVSIRSAMLDGTWSIALYDEYGQNFYTITASDLQRRDLELLITRSDGELSGGIPLGQERATSVVTVGVPDQSGIAILRAPLPGLAYIPETDAALAKAICERKVGG